ncbi:hypothetical protein SBOR_5432 [Sclerotinia borealis F-4128]|uniref:Uncharacterized protein n=1 Tax=Sclerotinia borealis (strain F-4128) TaxID=1432307 RepID=W9CHD8_SCLBF|nr:hypothetical protein SBOR_5432 [Sclerotinia borealis F-4128]
MVYEEGMVMPQDIWDEVDKNNEVLHDVRGGQERVTTTGSTTGSVEEAKTSIAVGTLVAMSSSKISAPLPTPTYTPHVPSQDKEIPSTDAGPSKYQAAENEASESRPHYSSEQTENPDSENNKQQNIPPEEVQKNQDFNPMIKDNFPIAMNARSAADLPPIPPWNNPPTPHVKEKTPLFIAFTRNWPLLQQTVVSWITSGWPAEDIYIVENTGTMRSNEFGRLSLQNPFFLNHTRLHMLGVNVIITPTLYTFAQLQNFFLWTAIEKDLDTYFWGHMDIIPITFEEETFASNQYAGHRTIYQHAVEVLRSAQSPHPDPNASDPSKPWAMRFFAFDYLTLVNRAAFESIGGFDTTIPFYHTDCDMYDRLVMAGYEMNEPRYLMTTVGNDFDGLDRAGSGYIFDVANSIDDLIVLYRKKNTVAASFTDQTRPEDIEAVRKHNEEQLEIEQQAQYEEEARYKAEANQKQAAIDDDNAQAYAKAMQEQAILDNKAEEIEKQVEEKPQNVGNAMDYPNTNADSSEGYGGSNEEIRQVAEKQQELRQANDMEEKEWNPVVANDPYQSDSSITSSQAGEYKKRDLTSSGSTNPQFKSLEELHKDASLNAGLKEPIMPSTSTATTTLLNSDTDSDSDFDSNSSPNTNSNSNTQWITDTPNSPAYTQLLQVADDMVRAKYSLGGEGRNTWQHQQSGGQGEPYYRNADGFEKAIQMTITLGRAVYLEKWGTLECGLIGSGVTMEDEWRVREWSGL